MPMLTVTYLDTSAWSHLYNGAVLQRRGWDSVAKPEDLTHLRMAICQRRISILLSIVVLEELISEPENYRAKAEIALDLSDSTRPVKPTQILLTDTLKSYAYHGVAAPPVFRGNEQWRWATGLPSLILGGTAEDIAARREAIQLDELYRRCQGDHTAQQSLWPKDQFEAVDAELASTNYDKVKSLMLSAALSGFWTSSVRDT